MVTIQEIPAEFHFDYDLKALKSAWPGLHAIDQERAPSSSAIAPLVDDQQVDIDEVADDLWLAWLDFHNGHYDSAFQKGLALGGAGFYVAHLAASTYGSYFLSGHQQADYFEALIQQSTPVAARYTDQINISYVHALHLGRYVQSVPVVKAVSSGVVLEFKKAVEHCLALNPQHTPSLLAYAALMGEVISTLGDLPAKVTFGATRKNIIQLYDQALASPNPLCIVYLEAAKGLARLEKRKARDNVKSLFHQAVSAPRLDPMDLLDIREARRLLDDY